MPRANAAEIAVEIAAAERAGRPEIALRHFIQLNDNLVAEHNEARIALALPEPPSTAVPHWDAAIAGLVSYRLGQEGLPAPSWTSASSSRLDHEWTLNAGRYVIPVDRDRVPREFLDRGVLVDRDTLESV